MSYICSQGKYWAVASKQGEGSFTMISPLLVTAHRACLDGGAWRALDSQQDSFNRDSCRKFIDILLMSEHIQIIKCFITHYDYEAGLGFHMNRHNLAFWLEPLKAWIRFKYVFICAPLIIRDIITKAEIKGWHIKENVPDMRRKPERNQNSKCKPIIFLVTMVSENINHYNCLLLEQHYVSL